MCYHVSLNCAILFILFLIQFFCSIYSNVLINRSQREKPCIRGFASNKSADQPAHSRSPVSTFIVRSLETCYERKFNFLAIHIAQKAGLNHVYVCLVLFWFFFCCCYFTSQSTAMVMSGRSVHLATLFSLANLTVNQFFVHILSLVTDNNPP